MTIDDVFSVESVQESVTRVDIDVDQRTTIDARIFSGNKKQLKQQAAHLLVVFFNTMNNHKTTVEVSYEDIQDRVFKLKEREKNIITDRLKGLTPEERDADTILKVNKKSCPPKEMYNRLNNSWPRPKQSWLAHSKKSLTQCGPAANPPQNN